MNFERLKKIMEKKGYSLLNIKPGQYVEIYEKVGEGNSQRIWKFRGLVIKVKKPNHIDGTFTVRWEVAGHTIEKIYPLSFPKFEKVILLDQYKIRRNKLYYVREKVWKKALKLKSIISDKERNKIIYPASK